MGDIRADWQIPPAPGSRGGCAQSDGPIPQPPTASFSHVHLDPSVSHTRLPGPHLLLAGTSFDPATRREAGSCPLSSHFLPIPAPPCCGGRTAPREPRGLPQTGAQRKGAGPSREAGRGGGAAGAGGAGGGGQAAGAGSGRGSGSVGRRPPDPPGKGRGRARRAGQGCGAGSAGSAPGAPPPTQSRASPPPLVSPSGMPGRPREPAY